MTELVFVENFTFDISGFHFLLDDISLPQENKLQAETLRESI